MIISEGTGWRRGTMITRGENGWFCNSACMPIQLAFFYSIFLPSSSLILKHLRSGFRNNNLKVKLFLSQVCAYTHAKSMALKKADFKQPLSNALIPFSSVPGSHHGPRAGLSMPSRVLSAWCFPQSHTDCLFSHKFLTSFFCHWCALTIWGLLFLFTQWIQEQWIWRPLLLGLQMRCGVSQPCLTADHSLLTHSTLPNWLPGHPMWQREFAQTRGSQHNKMEGLALL